MSTAPCERCGQVHAHCRAHNRAGAPCGRPPAVGQLVCLLHGAGSPQALKATKRRLEYAAAVEAVRTFGLPVDVSPTDALLEEVRWTAGHVRWLRERVQELEGDEVVWGQVRVKTGGEDAGTTSEARPSVWVDLYHRERAHLVKVCEATIRAGVEERRVRLAESQGALVADVIRRILGDLQLTAAQMTLVGEVVPRHLRGLAEGAA